MDWNDLRTFLAITKHRNLTAAGRSLRVSQTTIGRRLAGLESRVGATLLRRTPTGYVTTAAGDQILANVERMEAEAIAAERIISGKDIRLDGLVTITTVETFAARILPGAILALHDLYPHITIELNTDRRQLNLARREADIAIRLSPFDQHEIFEQRLAEMSLDLYAAESYLAKYGAPDWSDQAKGHCVIALQDDGSSIRTSRWLSGIAGGAHRSVLANSRNVQLRACEAGLGIACLPCYLCDEIPTLRRLVPPNPPPPLAVWLGVHGDMRNTPRIRAVIDVLAKEIRNWVPRLAPHRREQADSEASA